MGFLSIFSKSEPTLVRLPSGSFTVDRSGKMVVSTLPSSFPEALMNEISTHVRATFQEAQETRLQLNEIIIHYPSFKIIARELRGGALIFLVPINLASNTGHLKRI